MTLRRTTTAALGETSVSYETIDRGASPHEDYVPMRGRIRFGVGQTEASIVVFLTDDDAVETGTEMVALRVTDPGGRFVDEAVIALRDDDRGDPGTAAAAAASATPAPTTAPDVARPGARRTARPARAAAQQPRVVEVPKRVTSLELRAGSPAPVTDPGPATPVTAAGLIAAIALARVGAELWYRMRAGTV